MMNENEFWIAFWRTLGAVLCALVLSLCALSAYQYTLKIDALKNQVNAFDIMCLNPDSHEIVLCMERAKK